MDWIGIVLITIGVGWIVYQYQSDRADNIENDIKIGQLGFDYKKRGYVYAVILIILGVFSIIR